MNESILEKNKKMYLKDFILVFFLLIGPSIAIGERYINTCQIIKIIVFAKCLFKRPHNLLMKSKVDRYILVQILYYAFISAICLFNDIEWVKLSGLIILNICAAKYIQQVFFEHYGREWMRVLMKVVCMVFLIDGLFVFFAYFSSAVRRWGYVHLETGYNTLFRVGSVSTDLGLRSYDIGIGSGALASFTFACVFACILYLYFKEKRMMYMVTLIILLITTPFMGRTGFLLELFTLFIFFCYYFTHKRNPLYMKLKRKCKLEELYWLGGIVILFIIGVFFINQSGMFDKFVDKTLPWIMELFTNFLQKGEFSSASTDAIFENMFFLPENKIHLIFGNGNLGRTSSLGKINSDVGYIRMIFGYGLIGTFLTFRPVVYIVLKLYRCRKREFSFLGMYLAALFLIVNVKELHTLGDSVGLVVLALYYYIEANSRECASMS